MSNIHDNVFKDLIGNRDIAISFLKQYMPKDLVRQINWDSVKLDSASVEHTRQQHKDNAKQHEQSDLCFLFQFINGELGACFVHIECQTTDDMTILIRTRHYQTAYLLDFIKRNKGVKKLPIVVSIIYYANKKPFSYSLDVNDYFENKELAKQYAFSTQFVDLAKLSDDELLRHRGIAGLDLVFKHIAQRNIDNDAILAKVTASITQYDSFVIQTILKYLANFSDMEDRQFCDKISSMQPVLEGDVMTVAQQWEQKGLQKGLQEGAQHEKHEIAKNMLRDCKPENEIIRYTGLTASQIEELKKNIKH
jgi:predicted transposase/invertase (TIGR01784 family)